jgi:photosystem II stability/assembly factor-like uncharacterized protein
MGGLWKTERGEAGWRPCSDDHRWLSQQTSCVTLDPHDGRTVYVGTGDFNGAYSNGFGVMKSENGGADWVNLGREQFGQDAVGDILVSPEDRNVVLVATGRGTGDSGLGFLWRSNSAGRDWSVCTDRAGRPFLGAWRRLRVSLPRDVSGTRWYFAVGNARGGRLLRSGDKGRTWTTLKTPMNADLFQDALDIAVSATMPERVYLVSGQDGSIWASDRAGEEGSWDDITGDLLRGDEKAWQENWAISPYALHLACLPGRAGNDVLYLGLLSLFRTLDGGKHWDDVGLTEGMAPRTHRDQHCMAVDPHRPGEALIGNDGGLGRLSNFDAPLSASTPPFIVAANGDLGITQLHRLDVLDARLGADLRLLTGAQDNGSPFLLTKAASSASSWNNAGNGYGGYDGGWCAWNPVSGSRTAYVTAGDIFESGNERLRFYRTDSLWERIPTEESQPTPGEPVAFLPPLIPDPNRPGHVYMASDRLWRWAPGRTWQKMGTPRLSQGGAVQCLATAKRLPVGTTILYAGSSDGHVWRVTLPPGSGTPLFEPLHQGVGGNRLLPNRAVTCIAINPANPRDIVVGFSGTGTAHVYRCTDTDAVPAWTAVHGGTGRPPVPAAALPDVPVNAVAFDPDDPDRTIFVGTDIGVFATTDSGTHWQDFSTARGLPNVQVTDLKFRGGTRELYAATFGRGVWFVDLSSP